MTRSELQAALSALKRHVAVHHTEEFSNVYSTYMPLIDALKAAEVKACFDIGNMESAPTPTATLCLVIPLEEEDDDA